MSENAPSTAPLSAPQGAAGSAPGESDELPLDLPCVECDYNLRGLMPDGRCPECGTSVARSLDPRLLRFAPPTYLRTLTMGLTVIFGFGALCVIAMMTLGIVIAFLGGEPFAAFLGGLVATNLTAILGTWLLTTREPRPVRREHPLAARRIARVALLVVLTLGFLHLLIDTLGMTHRRASYDTVWYAWALLFMTWVGLLALLLFLRGLMVRIPDRRLARDIAIVFGGILAAPFILAAAWTITWHGPYRPGIVFDIIRIVVNLWPLVFSLGCISVMLRTRRRLRDSAMLAQATWTAGARVVDKHLHLPGVDGVYCTPAP